MEKSQRSDPMQAFTVEIPGYVLDDLSSRFLVNRPDDEAFQKDLIRVFFAIEQAHWFYLDFYCTELPHLKTYGIKEFSLQVFKHLDFLRKYIAEHEKRFEEWRAYKVCVPTYGAILLTPDYKYCLLAQGFWAKSSWGFPKGKVDEGETPIQCATREIFEETGLDVTNIIHPEVYEETKIHDQTVRLYVIPGIPFDTKFSPQTRKEIRELQWFPVDALPSHRKDPNTKVQLGMAPNSFFMVIPFVKFLRKRIVQMMGKAFASGGSKGDEGTDTKQRRQQKGLGPQGDAPATREGAAKTKGKNVADKLGAKQKSGAQPEQTKQVQILARGGKSKARAGEKAVNVGKLRLDEFHSKALLNFKFDVDEIMACLQW